MKKAVLLVNLGTPDSYQVVDVRRYLRQFLMDRRVIDIPWFNRWMVVNLIIAPFRAPRSAKTYQEVWMPEGSPLKVYGERLCSLLQAALGQDYEVYLAMRYQNPSITDVLEQIRHRPIDQLIVVPLFPQYASATTGSVFEEVMTHLKNWQTFPGLAFVNDFYWHPTFIKAWVERAKPYLARGKYDYYVFSYHGVPARQIRKSDSSGICLSMSDSSQVGCCACISERNVLCYRAQCFATTRLLSQALGLPPEQCLTSFQSRLGRAEWIQPYTEDIVEELARKGARRVLAFSPAFVADCLETTIEVGEEYKEMFLKAGGQDWTLVESLNDHPLWVQSLRELVEQHAVDRPLMDAAIGDSVQSSQA